MSNYFNEREKVFAVLEGCKTIEQLDVAKKYFDAFRQKWQPSKKDVSGKVRLELDSDLFNLQVGLKEKNIPKPTD